MNYQAEFERELAAPSPQLERLALLLGSLQTPQLDVDDYVARLDDLALHVDEALPSQDQQGRVEALLTVLYEQMGFVGNELNYYEPDNSFLHRVLARRLGLPISLSLLYMAVGRRLAIPLQGMGFPGHFMLRHQGPSESLLIDPFYGRSIAEDAIDIYLTQIFGRPVELELPLNSYQVTSTTLILRLLNNLRSFYLGREELTKAAEVLDFMVLVAPEETTLWRERALLRYRCGQFLGAESDLRRVFYQRRQIHRFIESRPIGVAQPFLPLFGEEPPTEPSLDTLDLLSILEQIRQTVARLN